MAPIKLTFPPIPEKTKVSKKGKAISAASRNGGAAKQAQPAKEPKSVKVLAIANKIDVLVAKKRALEDLFRTLLHQLITAQIRVCEIDVATALIQRTPSVLIGEDYGSTQPKAHRLVRENPTR